VTEARSASAGEPRRVERRLLASVRTRRLSWDGATSARHRRRRGSSPLLPDSHSTPRVGTSPRLAPLRRPVRPVGRRVPRRARDESRPASTRRASAVAARTERVPVVGSIGRTPWW
jgi:hypothetical protein